MNRDVLVVTGPTATGKTELGVLLAERLHGEIVSADSMQVYRYMDIGTAKPTVEERRGILHHMIDVASPFERYSVAMYVEEASRCCDAILERGNVPIIVGGTGLYVESLILGRSFAPGDEDTPLRRSLEEEYDRLGGEALIERLAESDPERAASLHPNDKKRVVRALESAMSGVTLTEHDNATRLEPPRYRARIIVLGFQDRAVLYDRINRRVDKMLEQGLVGEVEGLLRMGLSSNHTAMQAIGYKELAAALSGKLSMDEAIRLIKQGSRRYAKRQISWCSRYSDALRIDWLEGPDMDEGERLSIEFWNSGDPPKARH